MSSRPILTLVAPLFTTALFVAALSGCGLGLDPFTGGEDGLATVLDAGSAQPVDVPLTGRTYSTPLSELTVLEPTGLQSLLTQGATGDLLFYVVDELADELSLAMTLADASGAQDPCQAVYALPQADWSRNPEFTIQDGQTQIDVGGQPLSLDHMDLDGVISEDGELWQDAILTSLIDTRELLGGSLPQGTDVCSLVEELGGSCQACSDGEEVCTTLQLELDATLVEMSFDPDASGC